MSNKTIKAAAALTFIIGLVLMIGGISTGKSGATVIGLIVSAVSFQQWQARRNRA